MDMPVVRIDFEYDDSDLVTEPNELKFFDMQTENNPFPNCDGKYWCKVGFDNKLIGFLVLTEGPPDFGFGDDEIWEKWYFLPYKNGFVSNGIIVLGGNTKYGPDTVIDTAGYMQGQIVQAWNDFEYST